MASYSGNSILDILTNNLIADGPHTFTANGVSLGTDGIEVKHFYGNHVITTSTPINADYFSDVGGDQDEVMCIRIFNGNLTIQQGVTFKPPGRTKGMFLLVKNNLTNNGTISMAGLGSLAFAPSNDVTIWSGANIPKSGSSGGSVRTVSGGTSTGTGGAGYAPISSTPTRGTGGGGSGAAARIGLTNSTGASGVGAQGTAWSGGAGGGAVVSWNRSATAITGSRSLGGTGAIEISTSSWTSNSFLEVGGGAGNPQGQGVRVSSGSSSINTSGSTTTASNNSDGTLGAGGLLVIAVLNQYIHNGTLSVEGSKGGNGNTNYSNASFNGLFVNNGVPSGGGSGGGSLNLIARYIVDNNNTNISSTIATLNSVKKDGGTGGDAQFTSGTTTTNVNVFVGGSGGSGTATAELSGTTYRRHLFFSNNNYYYWNPTTSAWVEAEGTGTEPFELYGLLDTELTNITYSQITDIPDRDLANIKIRTYVPN
jgi:hypothetical protein